MQVQCGLCRKLVQGKTSFPIIFVQRAKASVVLEVVVQFHDAPRSLIKKLLWKFRQQCLKAQLISKTRAINLRINIRGNTVVRVQMNSATPKTMTLTEPGLAPSSINSTSMDLNIETKAFPSGLLVFRRGATVSCNSIIEYQTREQCCWTGLEIRSRSLSRQRPKKAIEPGSEGQPERFVGKVCGACTDAIAGKPAPTVERAPSVGAGFPAMGFHSQQKTR